MGIKKTVARHCDHCGVEYQARVDALNAGMGKNCSRECGFATRKSRRVKCVCRGCGVEFEVIPAILKDDRGGKYCSDACCRRHRYEKRPLADRFWEKVDVRGPDECWPWTAALSSSGYGRISRDGDDTQKLDQAHRISWEFANGDIPEGLHVLHTCDNRACVNPAHLFVGTNRDNVDDKVAKGRQRRGETSPLSRLTNEQIIAMRKLHSGGKPTKEIAVQFNIHYETAYKIATRARWKHVD